MQKGVALSDFVPFPEFFEIEPDGRLAARGRDIELRSKRKPSGNSAKRKEYIRPDLSDIDAHANWEASRAPTSAARVAEELSHWFGTECRLCGGPIDMTVSGHHPARWNVDHIIPKSKGGEHVWGNVQLVHKGCNAQKSDLELPEPPPWLYAELLRAAISRFDNVIHVESEIEHLRYRATIRIAMFAASRRLLSEGLIGENDYFLARQESRALKDIALVASLQRRLAVARNGTNI